ncbi:MAG: hypothetical protein ABI999_08380 [Acidobacteriota bacterium]
MAESEEKVITNAPINAVLEGEKLLYDVMKHLTTLSSGSILLVATLAGTVFHNYPPTRGWALASILCFVVSIICSVSLMLQVANNTARFGGTFTRQEVRIRDIAHYAAAGLFVLGYVCFVLYALPYFT